MAYPRKLLSQNEVVKVDLKPHWLYFLGPAATVDRALIVVAILVVAACDVIASSAGSRRSRIVVAACWLVGRFIRWRSTYFVITNDKVIYRSGVFRKQRRPDPPRAGEQRELRAEPHRAHGRRRRPARSSPAAWAARRSSPTCATPTRCRSCIHDAIEENASGHHHVGRRDAAPRRLRSRRCREHAAAAARRPT